MPRLSALIEDFAERFAFEPTKVASLARQLREAGQLTQGARGVNAPNATALDAARLLLAMMLNCRLPNVVEDVTVVGGFVPVGGATFSDVFAPGTLESALCGLIEYFGLDPVEDEDTARYDGFEADMRLTPYRALAHVSIRRWSDDKEDWDDRAVVFSHPSIAEFDLTTTFALPGEYVAALRRFPAGFNQEPSLDHRALLAIGQIVAGHQPPHWIAE